VGSIGKDVTFAKFPLSVSDASENLCFFESRSVMYFCGKRCM